MHDDALAAARDGLGAGEFAARFREGCALSAEDALARTSTRVTAVVP